MEVDTKLEANHINEHMEATNTNSNGVLPDETMEEPLETDVVIEGGLDAGDKVPDGGWGWWIVLGSVIMHMLMGKSSRSPCADLEGGGREGESAPPPLKKIGFHSSTGPDPLKNNKATKPAFNVGPSSARQRNAI